MSMTVYGFRLRPVDELVSLAVKAGLVLVDHRRVGARARAAHLLIRRRQE